MPRTDDFYSGRHSALADNARCEQGNCDEPATHFSWKDGNFCSDCWFESGRPGRGK